MKAINQHTGPVLWTARTMSILFILFISVFAMDVFDEGNNFWKTSLALFIHLVPAFTIAVLAILAWNKELIGAIAFSLLGIFYIFLAWGRFNWTAYAAIAGPLIVIGLLYLAAWIQYRHHRA